MATVRAHDDLYRRKPGIEPRLVVYTDPLRGLLRSFVDDWNRVRPPVQDRSVGVVCPVSAVDYVAAESGVGASTLKHILGPSPSPTTLLGTADAILSAIDRPQAWHDGTLEVFHCKRGGLVPADDP